MNWIYNFYDDGRKKVFLPEVMYCKYCYEITPVIYLFDGYDKFKNNMLLNINEIFHIWFNSPETELNALACCSKCFHNIALLTIKYTQEEKKKLYNMVTFNYNNIILPRKI